MRLSPVCTRAALAEGLPGAARAAPKVTHSLGCHQVMLAIGRRTYFFSTWTFSMNCLSALKAWELPSPRVIQEIRLNAQGRL